MPKVATLFYPFTSLEYKHWQCYQDHRIYLSFPFFLLLIFKFSFSKFIGIFLKITSSPCLSHISKYDLVFLSYLFGIAFHQFIINENLIDGEFSQRVILFILISWLTQRHTQHLKQVRSISCRY